MPRMRTDRTVSHLFNVARCFASAIVASTQIGRINIRIHSLMMTCESLTLFGPPLFDAFRGTCWSQNLNCWADDLKWSWWIFFVQNQTFVNQHDCFEAWFLWACWKEAGLSAWTLWASYKHRKINILDISISGELTGAWRLRTLLGKQVACYERSDMTVKL